MRKALLDLLGELITDCSIRRIGFARWSLEAILCKSRTTLLNRSTQILLSLIYIIKESVL
jgi:hypothetical protein